MVRDAKAPAMGAAGARKETAERDRGRLLPDSRPPRRQWFADLAIALAHAAEVAGEMAAPLFHMAGDPKA